MGNWISESMYIDGGMFVPQYADTTWGIATTNTTATSLQGMTNDHVVLDEGCLQVGIDALEANNKPVKKKVKKAKLIKKEEIQYFPTPKAMREARRRR